jgi:DNA-binding transcriptional LysR family regulator
MELRDIEYFAVIAEHGHLGRAANALGLSQPALSKSLRRLEQALQAKVVKRTPKGVALTAEGSALLLRVRELRLSLHSIAREIADMAQGRMGHLRVGIGFPRPEQLLASAFSALVKDAPRARVTATISDNDVMVPALCNGELDLIVNYLSSTHSREGLVREHLYDDQYVVVASRTHRLAGREQVDLADLAHERWCVSPLALASQRRLHDVFREAGLRDPQITLECRSPGLRLHAVAGSDLLDWTSRGFVEQTPLAPKLEVLPVAELAWLRPVGLIYRQDKYPPPALKRLIDIIKETIRNQLTPR